MQHSMRGKLKADGRVGKIVAFDPTDKDLAYKMELDDSPGVADWYPADGVERLGPVGTEDGSPEVDTADAEEEGAPEDSNWSHSLMLIVMGNLMTLMVVGLMYLMSELFASYLLVILYAFLLSEALWLPKVQLQRLLRGWLSHAAVGAALVLGLITAGAVLFMSFSVAGCLDAVHALHDAQGWVASTVNTETVKAWGIDESMIRSGMEMASEKLEELELEYNSTAWWPLVENLVAVRHSMRETCRDSSPEVCARFTANVSCADTSDEDPPDFYAAAECCACGGGILEAITPPWEASNFSFAWIVDQMKLDERWHILVTTLTSHDEFQMHAQAAVAHLSQVGGIVLGIVTSLTSSLTTSIFFVSLTISLLGVEHNILHELVGGLFGNQVEDRIRHILGGVFFYPPALATCRVFFTFAVAQCLWLPYPALMAMLTCLVTFVPMLSAYPVVMSLPWVIGRAVAGYYGSAVALVVVQYLILGSVEGYILGRADGGSAVPTWATGLAIVLGFERFGVQAFVLGPLTASMVFLMQSQALACMPHDDDVMPHTPSGTKEKRPSTMRKVAAGMVGTLQKKDGLKKRNSVA